MNQKIKALYLLCLIPSTGKPLSEALFMHHLTHNMTTDCSLNYKFNAWKFQAQTCTEIVSDIENNFVHNMFSTCSEKRRASDKDLLVIKYSNKVT